MSIYKDYDDSKQNGNVKWLGNESWWDVINEQLDQGNDNRELLIKALTNRCKLSRNLAEKVVDQYEL